MGYSAVWRAEIRVVGQAVAGRRLGGAGVRRGEVELRLSLDRTQAVIVALKRGLASLE